MFAQENHLRWTFGPRGGMPAVTVNSYDNTWPDRIRELEREHGERFAGGTVYIGTRGIMATGTYGDNPRIVPRAAHMAFPPPTQTIPRSRGGVKRDLIEALKGGPAPSSSFDYAGPFTEFVLTGVLASNVGAGRRITWDVERQTADLPEAQALVRRQYRAGWEV
jgi:hypothetical protein